jgi:hypothetical protein
LSDDEKKNMTEDQIKLYEKAIELRGKYSEALAVINDSSSSEAEIEKAKK